jgi:UDP-N-acetylmuramoylalanine-D-glutamate ligase
VLFDRNCAPLWTSKGRQAERSPDVAVITNVEADHLDNYASLADIEAAFTAFGQRVTGMVLTCADDPGAEAVAARLDPARVRRYGQSPHADYRLLDVASRGMAIGFTVAAAQRPELHRRLLRSCRARLRAAAGGRGHRGLPRRAAADGAQGRGPRGAGA